MAFLTMAAGTVITQPNWLWETLLLQVFKFIEDYGWRVVFFTVCLKLLLSPLDIYQRYKARKNQIITERLKPQMEKLQKQYSDRNVLAQKQMQLQKQAGFSYFSACLPAIVTMAIMFSLFGALQEVSKYMNFNEYYELYNVYIEAEASYETLPEEEKAALRESGAISDEVRDANDLPVAENKQYARIAVRDYYDDNKQSFLWIKNIWSPDVPWTKAINDEESFKKNVGNRWDNASVSGLTDGELGQLKSMYGEVMYSLLDDSYNSGNGYLILPILCVLLSVSTQLISMRQQKRSGQTNEAMGGGSMKVMMFIMPLLVGYFSLFYTAAFSLYLVVSYAFSLIISLVSELVVFLIDRREKQKQSTQVQKYGRPDPNDL